MFGSDPWPAGVTTLQFYAPVDLTRNPELAKLVLRWRDALSSVPVTLVEDQWLHVTLEAITDKPAGEISQAERNELAGAVQEALKNVPAYSGTAGSCLAYLSGAIVDISPAQPLLELHRILRHAVHSVRGSGSTAYQPSKPHMSLGYATKTVNSDPIQRQLRKVDPNNAPLHLSEVQLVEISIDQQDSRLEWETVAKFDLVEW